MILLGDFLKQHGDLFFHHDFFAYRLIQPMRDVWIGINPRILLTMLTRTGLFSDHDIRLCSITFADMVSHMAQNRGYSPSRLYIPVAREYLSLGDEERRQRFFCSASSEYNDLICYQRDNHNREKWSSIWAIGSLKWILAPCARDAAEQAAMCARMAMQLSVQVESENSEYMKAWNRQAEIIRATVKCPF